MTDPGQPAPARPRKGPGAFRTIGEVAGELDLPAHVLRFWETKFPQLKPVKRGGGRRYYRPEDILLLRRIRQLLYEDGYTIRGVQQLLESGPPAAPISGEDPDASAALEAAMPDTGSAGGHWAEAGTQPACLDPATRAKLEEIRRDLRHARALLDALLRPPRAP